MTWTFESLGERTRVTIVIWSPSATYPLRRSGRLPKGLESAGTGRRACD